MATLPSEFIFLKKVAYPFESLLTIGCHPNRRSCIDFLSVMKSFKGVRARATVSKGVMDVQIRYANAQ